MTLKLYKNTRRVHKTITRVYKTTTRVYKTTLKVYKTTIRVPIPTVRVFKSIVEVYHSLPTLSDAPVKADRFVPAFDLVRVDSTGANPPGMIHRSRFAFVRQVCFNK